MLSTTPYTSPISSPTPAQSILTSPQKSETTPKLSTSPLIGTPPSLSLSTSQALPAADRGSSGGKEDDSFGAFVNQVRLCAVTIQSCAEHQKRMTDDVLQLSRLRSHKLVVVNTYYRPWDMVQTALRVFGVQADRKVK
jgi:hypothetical protein